jgi:signal transduction histidine kinase/DNA-binding response OmpR family regulator
MLTTLTISLVSGFVLWAVWLQDREQRFARTAALLLLANLASRGFQLLATRADLMPRQLALTGMMVGIGAAFVLAIVAIQQLQRKTVNTRLAWRFYGFLIMASSTLLYTGGLVYAASFYLVLIVSLGVYATVVLWPLGWTERCIAVLMLLAGGNAFILITQGEVGLSTQVEIGTFLRIGIAFAFLVVAMTRSRENAEALRNQLERLNSGSLQGILVAVGADIRYANPAALRMLGLPAATRTHGCAAWRDLQAFLPAAGDSVQEVPCRCLHNDGRLVDLNMSAWPVQWAGSAAMQIVLVDDTENKRAREIEEASRVKSQFLANVSHEIRTPMNAILGLLKLMSSSRLSPVQMGYATKAEGAAKSLLKLLNDLLDFSKIEAGKMELELAPFELELLMRDLSVILSGHADKKPVEVLYDMEPGLPELLVGDALRLLQVLINLSTNAFKFTERGAVIVQCRQVAKTSSASRLRFSVKDTGIGIAPEHVSHIFEAFTQAEASTTRRFGGTGLGLSICTRLLQLMGSTLQVQSTPGQGSEFFFEVSLQLPDEVITLTEQAAEAAHPDQSPLDVLVVDDNPDALRLLAVMATSQGWQVQAVDSGAQAVSMVQGRMDRGQRPFDVILIDWEMAPMDGLQTLQKVESLSPIGQLPVTIMVSGHGRYQLEKRTEQERGRLSDFLVKPVTSHMLSEAVKRAMLDRTRLTHSDVDSPVAETPRNQRLSGLRILLAEDNPLNQIVATELLATQGAIVVVADNGQLAVDAVASAIVPFDLVLMDMQMPVLDGCAATRMIRGSLGNTSLHIMAMTANTSQADRDACLMAGMNDHIGKPFDIEVLVALILKAVGKEASGAAESMAQGTPDTLDAVGRAVQSMGGDRELYLDIVKDYLGEIESLPYELNECLERGDFLSAKRLMHTIKGISATVGATHMAETARRMELAIQHAPQDAPTDPFVEEARAAAALARIHMQSVYTAMSLEMV